MNISGPRSMLFVPGNRPERFEKAMNSGADAVILDLEDSVGISHKTQARDNVSRGADYAAAAQVPFYVRVNAQDSEWFEQDLGAAVRAGARGLVVPKCEQPAAIHEVERMVSALERGDSLVELVLILETARGVLAAEQLAQAGERPRRLVFGAYDFAFDMGVDVAKAGFLMTSARTRVSLAAKAARIQGIDTVFADIHDAGGMRRQTEEAQGLGFTGKLVIHPDQVPIVHDVLSPTPGEIEAAHEVVEAFREAESAGIAAITIAGKLVDYPIAQRSEEVLENARRFGLFSA